MQSQEKIIINSCQTCRLPIYHGEPVYSSSKGESGGHFKGVYGGKQFGDSGYSAGAYGGNYSGTHASESWAQCSWCYDQWQAEVKANKKFWIWWWLGSILLMMVGALISILAFPGLEGSTSKPLPTSSWHRLKIFSIGSWKVPLLAPVVMLGIFILAKILGYFLQPNVNRYKIRKRVLLS